MDPELNLAIDEGLTVQGKEDMKLLARRLQNAFPELLTINNQHSLNSYLV